MAVVAVAIVETSVSMDEQSRVVCSRMDAPSRTITEWTTSTLFGLIIGMHRGFVQIQMAAGRWLFLSRRRRTFRRTHFRRKLDVCAVAVPRIKADLEESKPAAVVVVVVVVVVG